MPDYIHTEHLLLRPFVVEDAEAFWPLVSLPDVLRYVGERPQTSLDGVRELLDSHPIRDYAVHGFGRMACIEKSTGRLIGFSGLKYMDELRDVDIGYRFLPDCWGKGYATESARVLMEDGVRKHGIRRIIGLVDPENGASARVLKKLGLVYERKILLDGHLTEFDMYATGVIDEQSGITV